MLIGPYLRCRLIARTGEDSVHTLLAREAQRPGGLMGLLPQAVGIGLRHIREAGAEALVVGTDEGVGAQHIDVVRQQHQVPGDNVRLMPPQALVTMRVFTPSSASTYTG